MKKFKNFLQVTKNGLGALTDVSAKVTAVAYISGIVVCLIIDAINRHERVNRNNNSK